MSFIRRTGWKFLRSILILLLFITWTVQDGEIVFAALTGYQTCSDCNGLGKTICTNCDGNGYIIKAKKVSNGTVYMDDVGYDFKSYINYKGCADCGGTYENAYKNVYYSDANFSNVVCIDLSNPDKYVGQATYKEGTGYSGSCSKCGGDGEVAITYQIKYHGNGNTGGSMANSTHTYDVSQTLRVNQFTRNGYTFIGWSKINGVTTDTGKDVTVSYKPGEVVRNLASEQDKVINLYAIWQRNQYTVTYDANGGIFAGDSATQLVYYDRNVDLSPSCKKEGYIFLGWAISTNDSNCLSSYVMPAKNITLYALYSIPVSDIKAAHLISYNTDNPDKYNLFELEEQSQTINGYIYSLSGKNLLSGLKSDKIEVWLLLYDHAGNQNQIPIDTPISSDEQEPENIPVPNIFLQTVEHYLWNRQTQSYQYYVTTSELIYEGETYIPNYISKDSQDYPMGYEPERIDGAYIVSDETIVKAYYKPISYTVSFDANGGECNIDSKIVYKGDMYGELPTPSRTGYNFQGWYTAKKDGLKITATDIYTMASDSILYAMWEIRTHNVVYDYSTNGGISAEMSVDNVNYGENIDMTVEAVKEGWEFIGWNTNPDAIERIDSLKMGDEDVLLYAIYKKKIKAVFIDWKDNCAFVRENNLSIYNNETRCQMIVPQQNIVNGWKNLGWSTLTEADAATEISSDSEIWLVEDSIFYGCYEQDITISYDTNGSAQEIAAQVGKRYFNASDTYKNPEFVLANAPTLEKHSFVSWKEYGTDKDIHYKAQECVKFEKDTLLVANWDSWPEIEAYDRYFTLEEAISGVITSKELLKKVTATDKEDGILVNGIEVVVKDYDELDFINLTENTDIKVVYEATDSFGNYVTKVITVHIVDTTVKISPVVKYVRFINKEVYSNEEGLVSKENGGVETTSIWRTNGNYQRLLEKTLSNSKKNEEVKTITFLSKSANIIEYGSGDWEYEKETWVFTYEDIKKMDEFTDTYGFGNIKTVNGTELFIDWFGECME